MEIKVSDFEVSTKKEHEKHDIKPGKYIKLTVSDTGEGMDKITRERIFEPYFTTKKQGEGSGMGLAVVHGIVKSYGGEITLETEFKKGSLFNIYFPVIESDEEPESMGEEPLPGGSESILFVDDEETLVVNVMKQILEKLGYKVSAETDSSRALSVFSEDPSGFDLLITDQIMPGMTGTDLAKEILKIRADIPIILCTGFSDVIGADKIKTIGISEFIMKPFDIEKLARVIRKVLRRQKN